MLEKGGVFRFLVGSLGLPWWLPCFAEVIIRFGDFCVFSAGGNAMPALSLPDRYVSDNIPTNGDCGC